MFDAFNIFIRQTADTIHHAIDIHAGRIEVRVLGTVERIVNARFNRLESLMSAQTEAFTAALSGLMSRVNDLNSSRDAAIEGARAAQAAKDAAAMAKAEAATDEAHAAADTAIAAADAQVKDATDKLIALTAALSDHAEAIVQTASAATDTPVPVVQEPAEAIEPVPAPEAAPIPTPAPDAAGAEAVAPASEPVTTDAPQAFAPEPENAEDRAAVAPASTTVP